MYFKRHKGIVALALLSVVLISITSAKIASVSLNKQALKRDASDTELLKTLKQHLLGFSLRQAVPGTLPCPDIDNDGDSDLNGTGCEGRLGFYPFRTLNVEPAVDASGAPVWYAVALNYADNSTANRNSSLTSLMRVDDTPAAAVILLPGEPLYSQAWGGINPKSYLEGINSDSTTPEFTAIETEAANDRVSVLSTQIFWRTIEQRVLRLVANRLNTYITACGGLPWASSDTTVPFDSTANTTDGALPFSGNTLPANAAPTCAPSPSLGLPPWVRDNWADQINYQVCDPVADGNDCLSFTNRAEAPDALIMAPGIPINNQSRSPGLRVDFYEDENSDTDNIFTLILPRQHTNAFNDQILFFNAP